MDNFKFISIGFLTICLLAETAGRQDDFCSSAQEPTAVLEGADAVLTWKLAENVTLIKVKLFHIDSTEQRHRLMVINNGDVLFRAPAYDNRLHYGKSTSLSFTLRDVKRTDRGMYEIQFQGGPSGSQYQQCNMNLTVVNGSASTAGKSAPSMVTLLMCLLAFAGVMTYAV